MYQSLQPEKISRHLPYGSQREADRRRILGQAPLLFVHVRWL
jgi:hypothetical protein